VRTDTRGWNPALAQASSRKFDKHDRAQRVADLPSTTTSLPADAGTANSAALPAGALQLPGDATITLAQIKVTG